MQCPFKSITTTTEGPSTDVDTIITTSIDFGVCTESDCAAYSENKKCAKLFFGNDTK